MKPVAQEDLMGCGIACVAYALNKPYAKAKKFFSNPKKASFRGHYCREIVSALGRANLAYDYLKITERNKRILTKPGVIVFVRRGKKHPDGHYLIRTARGWMNSWINFPSIRPLKAGFQKRLPGKPQWVVYPVVSE